MDTEQKRTYDKKAKKILSNKRILAHILQRVVDELRDKSIEQIVCYMDGDIEMDKVALQPPNISRSFFADSSYMLSFSVLCSCVCSRLISPSVSSWHKQDNTLMHQSPGHIQRRTPYNF